MTVPGGGGFRWAGRRVLITGGSGFIGTNAVRHFAAAGADACNLDLVPPRDASQREQWVGCDIRSERDVMDAVTGFGPDTVFHLAARTDLLERRDPGGYAANTRGVHNLLAALRAAGTVRRLIVASSRMVCKIGYVPRAEDDYCPPNLYGESKVETERIVREDNPPFEWIIVRPTSIWGPWFGVPYRNFFDAIARGVYRHPGSADPEKSFGFVGNFVYQLECLGANPCDELMGRTIYQCDYPPLRLRSWADLIRRELAQPPIKSAPQGLLRLAAMVGDAVELVAPGRAPLTNFRLNNLLTTMVYPTEPLERTCGALPHSLPEGVQLTVAWMRQS
ncbi:MAG TPA: NAD(P)-dependent oxidoreductase [Gemmatimonadales bacterium]|nr:NAD(P)-dependent oxidoreductase [Gemmatimonadales bacterium]